MEDDEYRDSGNGLLLGSAIIMTVGFLIVTFGASLRDNYSAGTGYDNAVHLRIAPGLILVIGLAIAVLGLFGVVAALMRRSR